MNLEQLILDMAQRLSCVETKLDTLLKADERRFDLGTRTLLALLGSATAIVIAIVF